jgi:predicted O-linked N-acetylglucosamine transferase (SPINDLY family)
LAKEIDQAGRHTTAIPLMRHLAEQKPSALNHHVLARTLFRIGKLDLAEKSFVQSLAIEPTEIAHNLFARLLFQREQFPEAETHIRAAIALSPEKAYLYNDLGRIRHMRAHPVDASRQYRRAVELNPTDLSPKTNLMSSLRAHALHRDATELYRATREFLHRGRLEARSGPLFGLHYDAALSPEFIFEEHASYGRALGEEAAKVSAPLRHEGWNRDPSRPLRVGYVSPDFFEHPVANFIEPVLAHHDRSRVEAFCYSDKTIPDATTARLRRLAHNWRHTSGVPDDRLIDLIRHDKIDVLVDLTGLTANNRLRVFARKPAPVQASWIGYFNTTGVAAIDYRITDRVTVPVEAERYFVEKVFCLPRSSNCFLPPPNSPG